MNKKKSYQIQVFDELPSTNEYIKNQRDNGENVIVIAKRQTGGRGTKGRSFSSEIGGVYLSRLTFYHDFSAKRAFEIMAGAATAVCKTLKAFGVTPQIKWPNDIFVNDKKICGILIENTFSGENIHSSIVGIGVNVSNPLPEELREIATTLCKQTGKTIAVEKVTKHLLAELKKSCDMKKYLSFVAYMGRAVTLIIGEKSVSAKLLFVDKEGGLNVEIDGKPQRFTAGEISVRI